MSSHFSRREFIDGAGALAASSILPTPVLDGLTSARATERLKPEELRNKLQGVIAFPVTPLKPDLTLDIPGLRKNLQRLLETSIAAVVAAGGTGELYSLAPDEHLEVVRATVEEVRGRIPVIAGVGFNVPIGVELAEQSARAGADAILALPPYYFNADEEGLANYYAEIGCATALGLIVYSRDWVNPSPAWVEQLAARVPTLACWKDGQGDLRRYQQIINRVGDRLHWIGGAGDDCVPGYYSIGVRCYTSSIATVAPKLSLKLHEIASAGDSAALMRLMNSCVIPLYELRARRKGYEVSVMKEMMNALGLAAGPVRPPLPQLRLSDVAEVKVILENWKPFLS
ncbi:MAG TPA: dihydrodipicolinate synthase family protein [Candidatus Binatia bacterium]|nr:dihydrodipicolinate synthase family protein [Candidatus Binatia bacterium]